jgi:hypothetical protein
MGENCIVRNFTIYKLDRILLRGSNQEDEMEGECMNRRDDKFI